MIPGRVYMRTRFVNTLTFFFTVRSQPQPDGVQRGLVGDIIARFEKRGYKLVGLKMVWVSFFRLFRLIYLRLQNYALPFLRQPTALS